MKQWAPGALCASSLVFGMMASRAQAQTVNPCGGQISQTGDSEITGGNLEMPVPNVGTSWRHDPFSTLHTGRDKYALDLNLTANGDDNFDNGLPVLASAAGVVGFSGNVTCGYGNVVMIEHNVAGTIFYTMYAHMDPTLLVANGDVVRQGQAIGYVARSGTTSDHLHWSVRKDPSPRYALLNDQSLINAPTSGVDLASDTRMIWRDDFANASTWEAPPGSIASPSVQAGQLVLPGPGTPAVVQHKKPVFVRSENGPYRVSFSARTDRLRSVLTTGVGLRVDCLDTATGATQRTVSFGSTALDSRGGWTVQSFPLSFGAAAHQCPSTTRFVRPALSTDSSVGTQVFVDWVQIEERPPVYTGGNERFEAYAHGGVRRFHVEIQDPSGLTSVQLVGANTREGVASAGAITTLVTNLQSTDFTLPIVGTSFAYYALRLQRGGTSHDLGPIGPVAPSTRAFVPGLGSTDILAADLMNIPWWVNYPFAAFDNSIDSYGIVNSASTAVTIRFTPATPVVGLTTFSAYYGGNPTRADVWAVDHATGAMVNIGQVTNTSLNWGTVSSASWPATTREILVVFERIFGDKNLHVDEILFQ
ncbi:MAG: M23 family metallopeptidase [Myxococcales bacterium]|nr:M23 family metallopeptidase [Myxococcales bacterium]